MFEASHVSYYADNLCVDIPSSVQLSGMNLNPFQKQKADEDKMSFQNKVILISGFCNQSIELNDWMQQIKKKNWVKKLVLLNYSQIRGMQTGEFIMQLETN
jgi:hypothetical protein